jgi:hypothetical protein
MASGDEILRYAQDDPNLRSPFKAISTKGRRSLPKNIMSPTKLVGAPNTPRATASSVVAFRRSLTS